jgi:uncharacterized membrane protein YfcA
MDLTLQTGIIVCTVEFACFFIKGLAAFGDPLISNPALSMFMENRVISPMNLLLSVPFNGWISWKNRGNFSMKKSLFMLICILCGIIPGGLLLKYAAAWSLKAFLGMVILGIGLEMISRNGAKPAGENRLVMAFVSFCSGITAGLYGINLFFVAYVERTTKNRAAFRGSVCFIFLIESVFRIIAYTVMGIFSRHVLLLSFVSLPGSVAGFFIGSRVDTKLSEEAIRRIVIAMFMFGGLGILAKAVLSRT